MKPFFKRIKVDPTDKFVVIASDGLWDTITDLVKETFLNFWYKASLIKIRTPRDLYANAQEQVKLLKFS